MPSADFTVTDDAWVMVTNGDAGTLVQLKSLASSVRIAVSVTEPVSDVEGFVLVPGSFEAIDIPLNGEEVWARAIHGKATIVALLEAAP